MDDNGFVLLWRKLQNNPIWTREKFTPGQAWVDLIMLANHKDTSVWIRGIELKLKRGQLAWSELSLAKRWKWSRNRVRMFLERLQKVEHQIEQQKNNVTTIITLINYDMYQVKGTTDQTPKSTPKGTPKGTQTINDNKKERKRKKFTPPTLDDVISYFEEKGYKKSVARKAFELYDVADWHDTTGKKIRNWKQKMISVWFKDENKAPKYVDL